MKKMVSIIVILVICFTLFACDNNRTTVYFNEETESADEVMQTDFETTIENSFQIKEIMTSFSEDRAWVIYRETAGNGIDNGENIYALIDTNGRQIFSVRLSELNGWGNGADIKATTFNNGVSCLYVQNTQYLCIGGPGMIMVDLDGNVLFDTRDYPESTMYYYLGRSPETVLFAKNTADFSSNKWEIGELDNSGRELYTIESSEKLNQDYIHCDFEYYGDDIYIGSYGRNGFGTELNVAFNRNTKAWITTNDGFAGGLDLITPFDNQKAIGAICGTVGGSVRDIIISSTVLCNQESWDSFDSESNIIDMPGLKEEFISDGVINYISNDKVVYNEAIGEYVLLKPGVYDYFGELISTYPDDWNIDDSEGFSEGYAPIYLTGADDNSYITVVDKSGVPQYDPIKVDYWNRPSWHGYVLVSIDGTRTILSPDGRMTDINEIANQSGNFNIGNYDYNDGFQKEYNTTTEQYDSFISIYGDVLDRVLVLSK